MDGEEYLPEDQTLRLYAPVVLFSLILAIILLDLFLPERVKVHWQMVALIGILAILPFLPLIKRISYGDLEAELQREADRTAESVEENLPIPEDVETSDYLPEDISAEILDLYEISPIAAVSKLRTEIEVLMRDMAEEDEGGPKSLLHLIYDLQESGELDENTADALEDVNRMTNKAVHEKNLSKAEAISVVNVGMEALERLYYLKEEGEEET